MGFIKNKIEELKQKRQFNAQNCVNRQKLLKEREERRKIEADKRYLEALIMDIQNRIDYVVGEAYDQQTVIFQVDEKQRVMFEQARDFFSERGFNAFFQKLDQLPVEALVISWI